MFESALGPAQAEHRYWRSPFEWGANIPNPATIPSLVYAGLRNDPNRVAIGCGPRRLTRGEVVALADNVAAALVSRGVKVGDPVAVLLSRSERLAPALLGVLRAGAHYVPLDPAYPEERRRWIVEDSGARFLVVDRSASSAIPRGIAEPLFIEDGLTTVGDEFEGPDFAPDDLAYVIYTSGSTGRPKGVEITHRAATNFLCSMALVPGVNASDTLLAVTTPCFDISVLEIFLPLATGARLEIAPIDAVRDAGELAAILEACGATVLQATPATWRILLENGWTGAPDLKALVGGEALPRDLARSLLRRVGQLWNMYGPTETTVWSSLARVVDFQRITLGRPIANTSLFVNRNVGSNEGELLIGGAGVARGYRGRDDLTNERFVAGPDGSRCYRTGDLVRVLPDGELEFIGRLDNQVKVNGFRVELGEIEALLAEQPGVAEAAASVVEEGGDRRIVAHIAVPPQPDFHADALSVDDWTGVWNSAYEPNTGVDPIEDFSGWNSSYDGERLDVEGGREWIGAVVERVLRNGPKRFLEIGCGLGLVALRVAPHADRYVGLDVSAVALRRLSAALASQPELAAKVKLHHRPAHDLGEFPRERFDSVVLNSVAQYFPSAPYFAMTLDDAMGLVASGGSVFVGDVRLRSWAEAFHASVELYRAADVATVRSLRDSIKRRVWHDPELLVDPAFFHVVADQSPGDFTPTLEIKRGRRRSELTDFRIDVTFSESTAPGGVARQWERSVSPVEWRRRFVESGDDAWLVLGVPNARLAPHRAALEALAALPDSATRPDVLREAMRRTDVGLPEPEEFFSLADDRLTTMLLCSADDDPWTYSVHFCRRGAAPSSGEVRPKSNQFHWSSVASEPSWGRRAAELAATCHEVCRRHLPPYMVPANVIPVPTMPRTPNGKTDRLGLPRPVVATPTRTVTDEHPESESIRSLWAGVLGIGSVGPDDDFFALGGTSLSASRFLAKLEALRGERTPFALLLEARTPRRLAESLRDIRPDDRLVTLRRGGTGIPLFLMHGLDGGVVWARDLVDSLPEGFPVYGVEGVGYEQEAPPNVSMNDLAAHVVKQIRRIQSHGPYRLLGHCFGGLLAREVQVALSADGECVSFLGLIDSPLPREWASLKGRAGKWWREVAWPEAYRWYRRIGRRLRRTPSTRARARPNERGSEPTPIEVHRATTIANAHLRALRPYSPRPLSIAMDLFAAERRALEYTHDPSWGWRSAGHAVRLHIVPGDHLDCLLAPNAQVLAESVAARLDYWSSFWLGVSRGAGRQGLEIG